MKSVVDLKPFVENRWLKHHIIGSGNEYLEIVTENKATSNDSNIWSTQLGKSQSIPSTFSEKFLSLNKDITR